MKLSWFAACLVVGCSGSVTEGPSGPIDPAPLPVADLQVEVLSTGVERIVQGDFSVGGSSGFACKDVEQVAGCRLVSCTRSTGAAGTPVDPGSITVTSPSFGNEVPLPIDLANGFGRVIQSGNVPGGEIVRVVGRGSAAVPAFDLQVKMPARLTGQSFGDCVVEAPTPAGAPVEREPCTLTDPAPTVRWNAAEGIAVVSLTYTFDVPDATQLVCSFDASAGTGKIPAAALARLPRGIYSAYVGARPNGVGNGKVSFRAYPAFGPSASVVLK